GIFDDASISLISNRTIDAIGETAGLSLDIRRFRPNFLIETTAGTPFAEGDWVGRAVRSAELEGGPVLAICMDDIRCVMINLDPATAAADPRVLKAAVQI